MDTFTPRPLGGYGNPLYSSGFFSLVDSGIVRLNVGPPHTTVSTNGAILGYGFPNSSGGTTRTTYQEPPRFFVNGLTGQAYVHQRNYHVIDDEIPSSSIPSSSPIYTLPRSTPSSSTQNRSTGSNFQSRQVPDTKTYSQVDICYKCKRCCECCSKCIKCSHCQDCDNNMHCHKDQMYRCYKRFETRTETTTTTTTTTTYETKSYPVPNPTYRQQINIASYFGSCTDCCKKCYGKCAYGSFCKDCNHCPKCPSNNHCRK
jgi:hypothetical protein